jgi:hypothetical protein
MTIMVDRDTTIMAMVAARSWRDAEYRRELFADPKRVLAEEGLDVDDAIEVKIVENTAEVTYLNLAPSVSDAAELLPYLQSALPLAVGAQLRVVQSTDVLRYVVMPKAPEAGETAGLSELELIQTATQYDMGKTVNYTTAVNWEAEAVGTTTTVTAEAEAVIVVVLT